MIAIEDPHLPGLSDLNAERLCDVTGAETVELMRLRYRPGRRAILHIGTGDAAASQQGTLWFFRGDKARRIARRNKAARYDTATGAVYEAFPHDHRMPQIRTFVERFETLASALTGGRAVGAPQLLRYRPGLSCTFRIDVAERDPVFVKLINDDDPRRIATMNGRVGELLGDGPVSIAPVIATDESVSAISYASARGAPLDAALLRSGSIHPVLQSIEALRHFWRMRVAPPRHFSRDALLYRAAESAAMVSLMVPGAGRGCDRVLSRLHASHPNLESRAIHGDMKLEHVFLDGGHTTLIDTESLSLGPADYDLAQLYGRLWQADLEGQLPTPLVEAAAKEVRRAAGSGFDWCLDVVALRLAKFYAQRPDAHAEARVAAMMERLW